MKDCDHIGYLQYTRRVFGNGTTHFCLQCENCHKVVKHPRHGNKLFLKASEIPPGYDIHPFREVR